MSRAARGTGPDRTALFDGVHVVVLSSFAVAQPLFQVLAGNAEFFVARGSHGGDIVALMLLLMVGVPGLLIALEAVAGLVGPGLRRLFHLAIVAVLVSAVAMPAMSRIPGMPAAAVLAGAVAVGVGVTAWYASRPAVRTFFTILAPAVVVFPAMFLLSPVFRIVFTQDDAEAATVHVANPAPVVFVIFDEMQLASIMDADRQIDAVRFPNFARLAADATWFRNATSVSDDTVYAVPALLTGRYPTKPRLPTAADYPENLFTLLGDRYSLEVFETWTELCPRRLCGERRHRAPVRERMGSLLSDLAVVYLHLVAPPAWTARLPSVGDRWKDFSWSAREGRGGDEGEGGGAVLPSVQDPREHFAGFLASIQSSEQPTLYFFHSNLPHAPWQYLPSGKRYGPLDDWFLPHGVQANNWWSDDEWETIQAMQRYLLQVAFVDRLLGQLVARLKERNLYERALIVVSSDHGTSFRPGDERRAVTRSNVADIASIPLLIKTPFQAQGVASDRNVEAIDVVPTIAAVLGITLPWAVDGQAALGASTPERPWKRVMTNRGEGRIEQGRRVADFDESLERQLRWFGSGTPVDAVFRIGPHPELLGQEAAEKRGIESGHAVELEWATMFDTVDLDGDVLPTHVKGVVVASPTAGRLALAIAVNGSIRATTWTYSDGGRRRFTALIPESALRAGRNDVDVFVISKAAKSVRLEPVATRAMPAYELADAGPGGRAALLAAGKRFFIERGRLVGYVERSEIAYKGLNLGGWAADPEQGRAADAIVVFVGDKFLYAGRPTSERGDVVDVYKSPGVRWAGFEYRLPLPDGTPADLSRVRVFAVTERGVASELPQAVQARGSRTYALSRGGDGEGEVLVPAAGTPVAVRPDAVQGHVDGTSIIHDRLIAIGWAADVRRREVADEIVVFIDGHFLFAGPLTIERPDLVEGLGSEAFRRAGFFFNVALPASIEPAKPRVRVFAVSRSGQASELDRANAPR